MKTYAIVVTYNGSKWVENCFSSLLNSSIPLTILAIDNDSTDITPSLIRDLFPQIEVIETGKNLGFGKANNIGFRRALDENAEYVFLLNQDAWVEKNTIEHLIMTHKTHEEFGVPSPIPYDGTGEQLDRQFKKFYSKPYNLNDFNLNELHEAPFPINFINAAAWLLPLSTIKKTGLFNPIFKQRGEDVNYCHRCLYHNQKIGFVAGTKYYHDRIEALNASYSKKQYANSLRIRLYTTSSNINKNIFWKLKEIYNIIRYYKNEYKLTNTTILNSVFLLLVYIPNILLRNHKHRRYFS